MKILLFLAMAGLLSAESIDLKRNQKLQVLQAAAKQSQDAVTEFIKKWQDDCEGQHKNLNQVIPPSIIGCVEKPAPVAPPAAAPATPAAAPASAPDSKK